MLRRGPGFQSRSAPRPGKMTESSKCPKLLFFSLKAAKKAYDYPLIRPGRPAIGIIIALKRGAERLMKAETLEMIFSAGHHGKWRKRPARRWKALAWVLFAPQGGFPTWLPRSGSPKGSTGRSWSRTMRDTYGVTIAGASPEIEGQDLPFRATWVISANSII